jgi:hypothetical protein
VTDKVLTTAPLTASAATMTPPVPPDPNVNESYLGRLAIGWSEGGIKFVKGTSETVSWLVSKIPEIPTMSANAVAGLVNVGSRFANGLVAVGTELYQMTPEERAAFAADIAQEAVQFVLVKAPDTTAATLSAIVDMTNQAIEKLISAALFSPDPGAFWQSLGSFTSQAVGEISVGWLTDAAVAKVLIRLKEARGFLKAEQFLSEQAKAVGLKLEKGLAGIKPGTLITDRMLALGMGITRAQKDYMIAVARKWGVNIYSRSRGAKAIELIEKGLATVKPYFIKPKSVNDIDKVFLGFEKLESDVVAMRKPNNWETVSAKMDSFVDPATGNPLTTDQRDLIVDRWQKRNKEWFGDKGAPGKNPVENEANFAQSDRYKLQQKSGKVQNLTLETEGNLEDAYEGKAFQVKPTNFQLVASSADPEALIPQLFEGSWKSIVGDIDLVAITFPNGKVPDIETLIKIYQDLQKPPLDMQHSATLTWLNEGAAKAMLKDHLGAAAEPMIEASVSSRVRAVLFDPKMSFENGDYFKKGAQFVHLAGGEINAPRSWALGGALTSVATDIARKQYAPPSLFPADMNRSAPPTRIVPNGPETLINGVWVPDSSVHPQFHAVGHLRAASQPVVQATETRLVVGVQTAVNETVPAGTTELPVLSLAQLYPDGTDGQDWFKAGDEVVIDPGTDAAFRTTLVNVGDRLVLAAPLPSEVLLGTMVAMVVPEVVAPGDPGVPGSTAPIPAYLAACTGTNALSGAFADAGLAADCLKAYGIAFGKLDGTFGENDLLRRSQISSLLTRFAHLAGVSLTGSATFPDVNPATVPDTRVRGEIEALAASGIVAGFPDGTFRPAHNLTVAQAATLVVRLLEFVHAHNPAAPDYHDQGTTAANYQFALSHGLLDPAAADVHGQAYSNQAPDSTARGLIADMLANAIQQLVTTHIIQPHVATARVAPSANGGW